jgi:2-polyprenyl-6-methoxyphenol hydroxylase-like FAD-dependent oxidoreductase
MIPKKTDVLIVGAGPTGLALAVVLAQSGLRPLIVERADKPQTTSRAAVIHAHTLEVLDAIGVTAPMLAEGRRIEKFALRDRDSLLGLIGFDQLPSTHRYLLMLPQDRTEAILLERLAELGVGVVRGVTFSGLSQTGGEVVAKLETPAGVASVTSRFVVGADGVHSAVRQACGIAFDGAAYPGSFVLADVKLDEAEPRDEVSLFFSPEGLVVLAPLPDGHYRVVATVDVARERPDAACIEALFAARGPTDKPLGKVMEVSWSSRFQLHHRLAASYRKGHVFVIGDAAHAHSPAGGQGMNTGLVDACTLGRILTEVLLGKADERALDQYEALRRPAAADVLALAGRLTTAATLRAPVLRGLRNAAFSVATRLPGVRRRLAMSLSGLSRRNASLS